MSSSKDEAKDYERGWRADQRGRRIIVDFIYPQTLEHPNEIEVGLECVRAADTILIRYDFVRDGWSISQASTFTWDSDDDVCDPDWQEVAFIEAWAREKDDHDTLRPSVPLDSSSSFYPLPISVKDKMPPYGEVVLAFYDGEWGLASYHVNIKKDTWWWADAYTGYELQFPVEYWMYCPPDPRL